MGKNRILLHLEQLAELLAYIFPHYARARPPPQHPSTNHPAPLSTTTKQITQTLHTGTMHISQPEFFPPPIFKSEFPNGLKIPPAKNQISNPNIQTSSPSTKRSPAAREGGPLAVEGNILRLCFFLRERRTWFFLEEQAERSEASSLFGK